MFTHLAPLGFVNTVLRQTNRDTFRQLYGEAPLRSDYAMWSLIADATPSKLMLFGNRKESVSASTLLAIKAMAAPEESGHIYLVAGSSGAFNGAMWSPARVKLWMTCFLITMESKSYSWDLAKDSPWESHNPRSTAFCKLYENQPILLKRSDQLPKDSLSRATSRPRVNRSLNRHFRSSILAFSKRGGSYIIRSPAGKFLPE